MPVIEMASQSFHREPNMKNVSRAALISLVLLIVCGATITTAKAQSLTSAPKLSTEIESLTKALTGEWSLSVKFEPSASAPNGLANIGEETWRQGPGGFTLLEEEHLQMPENDLFLLGILWWNSATKSLHGMDCQNLLPYTCDVKGAQNDITMNWDGKQFVIDEMETSKSGKKSVWHEVWSDITPTSFVQTAEYGDPGGPRKRLFTIRATRVTGGAVRATFMRQTRGTIERRVRRIQRRNCRISKKRSPVTGPHLMTLRPVARRQTEAPALVKRTGEPGPVDTS